MRSPRPPWWLRRRLVYDTPQGRQEVRARTVAMTVPAYVAADLVEEQAPSAAAALKVGSRFAAVGPGGVGWRQGSRRGSAPLCVGAIAEGRCVPGAGLAVRWPGGGRRTAASLPDHPAPWRAPSCVQSLDYPPVGAITLAYPESAVRPDRLDAAGSLPGAREGHGRGLAAARRRWR